MPFIARRNFSKKETDLTVPGRVYIHTAGLKEVFEGNQEHAFRYFSEVVCPELNAPDKHPPIPLDAQYFIATIWGDTSNKTKRADVLSARDLGSWPGNPEFRLAAYCDRFLLSTVYIGCGDQIIMVAEEEKLRRDSESLEHYMSREVPKRKLPWRIL